MINVTMSGVAVAGEGEQLRTTGIGSCLVITLYDPLAKIGALAHPMVPHPGGQIPSQADDRNLRYIEDAIDAMVDKVVAKGGERKRLEAKLIGGAHMFKVFDAHPNSIGAKNIAAASAELKRLGIQIQKNDTGGNVGRSATLDCSTGNVEVTTVF
jgi:chemotaxis protein CheD